MVKMKQKHLLIIIIISVVIGGLGGYFFGGEGDGDKLGGLLIDGIDDSDRVKSTSDEFDKEKNNLSNNDENLQSDEKIVVHITGGVAKSGVYELEKGDRVVNALQAAGGRSGDADLSKINLAASIYDGDRIYVPHISNSIRKNSINNIESGLSGSKDLIDLNRADKEEIQELSGIGPSKAENIIKYREKVGKFTKIKELLNVSGIGPKTMEKIKDDLVLR
jgi:competence protein ComEA